MCAISKFGLSVLIGFGLLFPAVGPASAACPAGSIFFAYGATAENPPSCVTQGNDPRVVARCFKAAPGKPCSYSMFEGGEYDGALYCCLAVAPPKPEPSVQETFQACYWDGSGPFCDGRCRPGEQGKRTSTKGCLTGRKIECCQDTFPR